MYLFFIAILVVFIFALHWFYTSLLVPKLLKDVLSTIFLIVLATLLLWALFTDTSKPSCHPYCDEIDSYERYRF